MKKCLKIILCALLSVVCVVCAAGIGLWAMVRSVDRQIGADLSALNLPGVWVYRDMAMQSGEGFSAFVMPHYKSHNDPVDLRQEALDAMASAEGWHVEAVTAAALEELLRCCQVSVPLHPAADAVYDAWFFRHEDAYPTALPLERPSGQWTLCFFDRDNGTYITLTEAETAQDADALALRSPEMLPLSALGLEVLQGRLGVLPILQQEPPLRLTALLVPDGLRGQFASQIAASGAWHEGNVSSGEFSAQLERMQEEVWPCLYPAADVVFDWCWQELDGAAWYDADTGLFIFWVYDS